MKLKGKLIEFVIVHDIVPMQIKWRKSASGIGRMFNDVFHIADEVVETFKVERNLHGCAIALMGMHRAFGIKSHIVEENANEVKIHATECMWNNKKDWTPEVCASIVAMKEDCPKVLIKIYYIFARRDAAVVMNSANWY